MHYDVETGAKDTRGVFSRASVISLSILVVLSGLYLAVNWYAVQIFFVISSNQAAIENIVKSQPVQQDMLRIPSLEIEREIVTKKADGKIQLSDSGDKVVLSGTAHSLGVTPFDTKLRSPLALLDQATLDTRIYVDLEGTRTAYQVTEILQQTQPNLKPAEQLVIYALDSTGKTALVEIRADRLGEVKIQ
jgi:hypothetical protein